MKTYVNLGHKKVPVETNFTSEMRLPVQPAQPKPGVNYFIYCLFEYTATSILKNTISDKHTVYLSGKQFGIRRFGYHTFDSLWVVVQLHSNMQVCFIWCRWCLVSVTEYIVKDTVIYLLLYSSIFFNIDIVFSRGISPAQFTHIVQGHVFSTGTIIQLPWCKWNKYDEYSQGCHIDCLYVKYDQNTRVSHIWLLTNINQLLENY